MQFTAHLDDLDNLNPIKKAAKQKEEQSFKLDIQAGNIVVPKKATVKIAADTNHQPKEKLFTADNVKFIVTRVLASVLIFIVGYIGINWSALSEVIQYRFGPQQDTTQDLNIEPVQDLEMLTSQNQKIPALNLQVTPPDMRIVIPKIDKNVPVVPVPTANLIARDWQALENDIQDALKDGVVHYPGTAYPDQAGNVVVTGHSSYFPWDPGRFKDVFALLHDLKLKDEIIIYFDQQKFIYQIDEIKVVTPDKIDVLGPTVDSRLTLITCTPIGTNQKRLIVRGKLIEGTLADGTKIEKLE